MNARCPSLSLRNSRADNAGYWVAYGRRYKEYFEVGVSFSLSVQLAENRTSSFRDWIWAIICMGTCFVSFAH